MTKLRLAIVGFGKIATTRHVPAIAASADVELVAIADPKATAPDVPNFPSLEKLLKDGPAIDAVTLCTPPRASSSTAWSPASDACCALVAATCSASAPRWNSTASVPCAGTVTGSVVRPAAKAY